MCHVVHWKKGLWDGNASVSKAFTVSEGITKILLLSILKSFPEVEHMKSWFIDYMKQYINIKEGKGSKCDML